MNDDSQTSNNNQPNATAEQAPAPATPPIEANSVSDQPQPASTSEPTPAPSEPAPAPEPNPVPVPQPTAAQPSVQKEPTQSQKPKKSKKPVIIASIMTVVVLISVIAIIFIHEHLENQRLDAESVLLKSDLTVEFGSQVKVSDCLASLHGELVDDFTINTEQLGEQTISFEYINAKNRKRPYELTINVVDTVKPEIFGSSGTYTLYTGYQGELTDLMLSVDNIDDRPTREIRGKYDLNKPGAYDVEYVITDASGNEAKKAFTLNIIDPPADSGEEDSPARTELTPISRIIRLNKTDQTKIGIDVSQWQGKIDWQKVKAAGVEFAMIRIGYQYGFGGEYVLDPYFEANLAGAKANDLPVGVYFYSYAKTPDEAKSQVEWIVEKLGNVDLELGIAFDWENWASFNSANMSLYTINKTAEAFLSATKDADYKPLLYSSKNYLDLIWRPKDFASKFDNFDVWLAQYYDYPTYTGDFQIWQMTDSGSVPGISGAVDIDIMYK